MIEEYFSCFDMKTMDLEFQVSIE